MTEKKREKGYYWCRIGHDWCIGYYCQGACMDWGFAFNGDGPIMEERFLQEIDENIITREVNDGKA